MSEQNGHLPGETGYSLDDLGAHLLLVNISVHQWRGQFQIKEAEVSVNNEKVNKERVNKPRWNLLPEEWRKKFSSVESEIRSEADRYKPRNLPIRGISMIPRKFAVDIFSRIDELEKDKMMPMVAQFCDEWEGIIQNLRLELTANQWDQAEKCLPISASALKGRFYVSKYVIPMGTAGQIEAVGVEDDEGLLNLLVDKHAKAFVHDTVRQISAGLLDEMNEAVDTLTQRIADKGVIQSGTIGAVRTAFEKLEGFDFLASDEVKTKLANAKAWLEDADHQQLNIDNRHESGSICKGLADVLRSVKDQCNSDAKAVGRHGRVKRAVTV